MPIGFLNPTFALMVLIVGLLSGALSVIRDLQMMYFPAKSNEKRTFFGWTRIAFVIAAALLWSDEHAKVVQLSAALQSNRGRLSFKPQNSVQITGAPSWPFKPGDIPIAAIFASNIGNATICGMKSAGELILLPYSYIQDYKSVFDNFSAKAEYWQNGCMPPNVSTYNVYFTFPGPTLDVKDIADLQGKKTVLCALGRSKWKDGTGCYTTDYNECGVVDSYGKWNWHVVENNMEETKIKCDSNK